jgi:hypothetical protein
MESREKWRRRWIFRSATVPHWEQHGCLLHQRAAVHHLANSAPPLVFGYVDDRVAHSRRCLCSLLARPCRFKPAPVALSFFPSSAPSPVSSARQRNSSLPQQLNPISLTCSFALPLHYSLTRSHHLSQSGLAAHAVPTAVTRQGCHERPHRGRTSTEHLSPSRLFL